MDLYTWEHIRFSHVPKDNLGWLKMCVSSGNGSTGTPEPDGKHLHVPSIIVTPPTPTGTMLWVDGWMGGWLDKWKSGRMDGQMEAWMYKWDV
uniref:Uncharacterized protein n=1 Tax=Phasianus colchicus TaxID=9054 RepID=A0A669QV45_PHACC